MDWDSYANLPVVWYHFSPAISTREVHLKYMIMRACVFVSEQFVGSLNVIIPFQCQSDKQKNCSTGLNVHYKQFTDSTIETRVW